MTEGYMLYILAVLAVALVCNWIMDRKLKAQTDEIKVKLVNTIVPLRKYYSLATLLLFGSMLAGLHYVPDHSLVISLVAWLLWILMWIVSMVLVNKKLREIEVPSSYIKAYNTSRLFIFAVVVGIALYISLSGTNVSPKAYELCSKAYIEMVNKNYKEALALYDEAIADDSSLSNAWANRGTCKYYQNDRQGACADWKKAAELGDESARTNAGMFCQ